jgi:hypothetical protein
MIDLTPADLPEQTALRLPVLATVLEILRSYPRRFDSIAADGPLHEGARMLRIVVDHRRAVAETRDARAALEVLYHSAGVYDPDLLDVFARAL